MTREIKRPGCVGKSALGVGLTNGGEILLYRVTSRGTHTDQVWLSKAAARDYAKAILAELGDDAEALDIACQCSDDVGCPSLFCPHYAACVAAGFGAVEG